jgi:hypothetical protein
VRCLSVQRKLAGISLISSQVHSKASNRQLPRWKVKDEQLLNKTLATREIVIPAWSLIQEIPFSQLLLAQLVILKVTIANQITMELGSSWITSRFYTKGFCWFANFAYYSQDMFQLMFCIIF